MRERPQRTLVPLTPQRVLLHKTCFGCVNHGRVTNVI